MNVVGYNIFIFNHFSLLINHIENNFVKYKILSTAISFTIYFNFHFSQSCYFVPNIFHAIKKLVFLLLNNVIEDYLQIWKTKKTKSKHYYQANKERVQETSREYYRKLFEDAKIKKITQPNIRNKNMTSRDRE